MSALTDQAVAAALSAEVKKISYRQTATGMVLGLELHPNEVPGPLATAPLGTRYRMVLVELADDDTPVIHEATAKAQVRSMLVNSAAADLEAEAVDRRAKLSVVGKERYENNNPMKQAHIRSCIYAQQAEFIAWADGNSRSPVNDKEDARQYIHKECGISSRREIATDERAYRAFLTLEERYLEQTGRRAEAR